MCKYLQTLIDQLELSDRPFQRVKKFKKIRLPTILHIALVSDFLRLVPPIQRSLLTLDWFYNYFVCLMFMIYRVLTEVDNHVAI